MTYDQLVYKLRNFQAVKIHWGIREIDILLNKGFICVESFPSVPLQVFRDLSDALGLWCFPEDRNTLGEIIAEIDDKKIESNPSFREIAFLDPNLLVEPTNLQRNSITGGVTYLDSSIEHRVQCMEESISSCLYNVTLETKIYQTLEWRWLKEMLDKKLILLKSPLYYHDAWESFMFRKYDWEERGGECRAQITGVAKCFYCSCWSACEESEGIWNNHIRGTSFGDDISRHNDQSKCKASVDFNKVKIETTVGELLAYLGLEKLFDGRNIWKNIRAGTVGYFDEFELRTFKERTLRMIGHRKGFSLQPYLPYLLWQSFFMKRKQFEYEQEIRFVLLDKAGLKSLQRNQNPSGVFLQTEPQRWIHEVVVHPDSAEFYDVIRKQLSCFGIERVVMSSLSSQSCK